MVSTAFVTFCCLFHLWPRTPLSLPQTFLSSLHGLSHHHAFSLYASVQGVSLIDLVTARPLPNVCHSS